MLPIRFLRDWTVHGLWLKTTKEAPGWFAEARFTSFEERQVWVCSEIHIRQGEAVSQADEENPARWDGTFYHSNCSPLHNSLTNPSPREGLMGHNWFKHWQERQLSRLRMDHKPLKILKAPSDWFLRLYTKGLNVMQRDATDQTLWQVKLSSFPTRGGPQVFPTGLNISIEL